MNTAQRDNAGYSGTAGQDVTTGHPAPGLSLQEEGGTSGEVSGELLDAEMFSDYHHIMFFTVQNDEINVDQNHRLLLKK